MPARLGRRRKNTQDPGWPNLTNLASTQSILIGSASSTSTAQPIQAITGTLGQTIDVLAAVSSSRAQSILASLAGSTSVQATSALGAVGQFARPKALVAWSIDGRHVPAAWDSFTMSAPGGYDLADLKVDRKKMPTTAGQGSVVQAVRYDGTVMFEGRIVATPKLNQDTANFQVRGWVATLERQTARIPWQLGDATAWQDRYSDPFGYSNSKKYDLFARGALLGFGVQKDTSYQGGGLNGYALLVKGFPVMRVAFTVHKTDDIPNFELALRTVDGLGADASFTDVRTWSLDTGGVADGQLIDRTLSEPSEIVELVIRSTGASTPSANSRAWVTSLRVNCFTTDDDAITSDIAAYIAGICGYNPKSIRTGSISPLPFDWSSDWPSALDYLSALEDWTWTVEAATRRYPGGSLYFGPWGRDGQGEWDASLATGASENLVMLPLYNQATTYFEKPAGVRQSETTFATDIGLKDPLRSFGVVSEWPDPITLNDPQPNDELAAQVNARMLQRITKQRVQGTVKVWKLRDRRHPFDIRAADTIKVTDFTPKIPAQRITGVTYNADGTVDLSVGRDASAGIAGRAALRGSIRHRKRRRR